MATHGLMLRLIALLAVLQLSLSASLSPEAGALFIHTYKSTDYGGNQQNWTAVQDTRGFLYIANNDGILEFDGVTWRKIAVSDQSVRSLAIDSRGVIFVGGRGTFGYLAAGTGGDLRFVSLLDKVPADDRKFNDIWDILPTEDGVYFSSYAKLFLYTPSGALKVFSPQGKGRFGRAFSYHGEVFLTSQVGLLTFVGGDLIHSKVAGDSKLLSGDPAFADGAVPLMAFNRRLYHFSLAGVEPFPTRADAYLEEHEIYSVAQLPSGDIAVGTKSGGLVLLNQKGELERIIRKTDGLPSNWISSIYSDYQGNVWLTTDNGVARFPVGLSHFGESQGIHGSFYTAVARIDGVLYVGTSLGLFRMRTVPDAEPVFTPVPEVQEAVFSIIQCSGLAFVGTERGLFVLAGQKFEKILPSVLHYVYDIAPAKSDTSTFYAAGGDGIQVIRRNGRTWTVVNKESTGQDFFSVAEISNGQVWATTLGGVWRINFSTAVPQSEQFKQDKGVPAGSIYVAEFRKHLIFASQQGLLKYADAEKRFVPNTELGSDFSSGKRVVSAVREDSRKEVWITGKGYHGILRGPTLEWFGNPLREAQIEELYSLYFDKDGTCWTVGNIGSLVRYERPRTKHDDDFRVFLRSAILTNDDRSIFAGSGTPEQPRLPHRDNALRFEYAAPFFEDESAVEYQYRLGGSDSNWSAWTKETRKDYTNLFEGRYSFEVHARNPHGAISREASYQFSLQAPWYRSWLAYAVYVAALLFAGWLVLRWRLQALQARNKWLEGVVEERTAEVRSERDQNEALLLNILPKPVASELRATGSVKPASFDDVTVCFSDFVGFTVSSEKLPPQDLISSLNEYFTAFDEIIGRYGLEKLKTIGDAYMFAGGLPDLSSSHAVDAVLAAMEMVEAVQRLAKPDKGVNWSIRLGLYSGPVVAGVVGVRKFAFDIWGNTVNFASRMESAGSANRVNMSETTQQRVFDFIDCEPRGPVRIKEGREMEMYFALRLKPELLSGPLVDGIPETFRVKYEKAFAKLPKSFPKLNGTHAG